MSLLLGAGMVLKDDADPAPPRAPGVEPAAPVPGDDAPAGGPPPGSPPPAQPDPADPPEPEREEKDKDGGKGKAPKRGLPILGPVLGASGDDGEDEDEDDD
ncbi:MAG TPA: hypothetical protein VNX21_08855 [Candidatus Thermoplasmatota archaeon]|nr:hypothetical protein [Candidatus Thermoplasmatota archaeon]